jgi:hypothetical protein
LSACGRTKGISEIGTCGRMIEERLIYQGNCAVAHCCSAGRIAIA